MTCKGSGVNPRTGKRIYGTAWKLHQMRNAGGPDEFVARERREAVAIAREEWKQELQPFLREFVREELAQHGRTLRVRNDITVASSPSAPGPRPH